MNGTPSTLPNWQTKKHAKFGKISLAGRNDTSAHYSILPECGLWKFFHDRGGLQEGMKIKSLRTLYFCGEMPVGHLNLQTSCSS